MKIYDNGLIKSLKRMNALKFSDGFLDLRSFPTEVLGYYGASNNVEKVKFQEDTYYKKFFKVFRSPYADAEILSSQLFNNAGIKSATYLPVYDREGLCVYCDDLGVDNENKFVASEYINKVVQEMFENKEIGPKGIFHTTRDMENIFNKENNQFANGLTYYAKRQLIKARILQIIVQNNDNSTRNMVYVLGKDGKIVDINVLDNEMSSISYSGLQLFDRYYFNDFSPEQIKGKVLIQTIMTSPLIAQFFEKKALHDFAHTLLDDIDVKEIAKEFKENFGYEIDHYYVIMMQEAKENVANDILSM